LLKHPTLDQLYALGLHGMAKAFAEIAAAARPTVSAIRNGWDSCSIASVLAAGQARRGAAAHRQIAPQASIEDVDYRSPRGLDPPCSRSSSQGTGSRRMTIWPDSVRPASGKVGWPRRSATKRARQQSVLYQRVPRLFEELALARGDGRHPRLMRALGRADLLILDDWGLEPLDAAARHDLLEILEERYGAKSTVVTSQLPWTAGMKLLRIPPMPTRYWIA